MKILILILTVVAFGPVGCAATHYYERHSDEVTFYLKVAAARGVAFASSLDDYRLHQAEQVSNTAWKVTIASNAEFSYFYIVDGAIYIPECRFHEKDDFGSRNCVFVPEKR